MNRRFVCDECTRADLLRAAAGRGLPAIEPGMPVPAGTGLTRRGFVSRSLGMALAVYGAGKLSIFDDGIANAASGGPKQILVSVFLQGGADSLSLLYPQGDPLYTKFRTDLAVTGGTPFTEDTRLLWHPALAPIAQLHDEGKVTVFPSIGYDHPDQSHFTSRHYWEVGATDPHLLTGWLGRYLDSIGSPDNPLQGLSLGGSLLPSLATTRVPVATIDAPGQYDFWTPGVWGTVQNRLLDGIGQLGSIKSHDLQFATAANVARQSDRLRRQLLPFANKKVAPPVTYPTSSDSFPTQLQGVAAMIAAGLPLHCVALEATGSYDTHADQTSELVPALTTTAASLFSFQRDLEARGIADRVLTLVWSEFGRRAQENGSGGTDHGVAAPMFVAGTKVHGGLHGKHPSLDVLDDGDLIHTTDFRSVYATVIEKWFGTDHTKVLDARYPLLPVLKA